MCIRDRVGSCVGFDTPGCGGSIHDRSVNMSGGGGGGGYLSTGKGEEGMDVASTVTSGFGGLGGFGVAGGLGANGSTITRGGFGAGGGGGGSGECFGGGGGGGYIGGKGGSVSNINNQGGGVAGIGFVQVVPTNFEPSLTAAANNAAGSVRFTFSMDVAPSVMASVNVSNTIALNATFIASLTSTAVTAWSWSGPDGFISSMEDPTPFSATSSANGIYTVTVTDNNQCTASSSVTVASSPPAVERIQNIPTMSEWGLIIYGLLILNIVVVLLRSLERLEEVG